MFPQEPAATEVTGLLHAWRAGDPQAGEKLFAHIYDELKRIAAAQLRAMRGREIVFHTGLCLLDAASGMLQARCIDIHVGFRELGDAEIEAYLDKEDALNCAGSAKSEGLGISLLTYLRGDDPNALIGLPLIALCDMLRKAGVALP